MKLSHKLVDERMVVKHFYNLSLELPLFPIANKGYSSERSQKGLFGVSFPLYIVVKFCMKKKVGKFLETDILQ